MAVTSRTRTPAQASRRRRAGPEITLGSLMLALGAVLGTGPLSLASAQGPVRASNRPNVILIYTDDQGSRDTRSLGADDLMTPGLDRLAREGVTLRRMYAPAPSCSPSRAGLLTGRLPWLTGVPGNVSARPGTPGLPSDAVTLAEVFRDAGYATAQVGKWHLGSAEDTRPESQGFQHTFGHLGGCIDNYSHFFYWEGPNRHDLFSNGTEVFRDGVHFLDLMGREVTTFLTTHRESPFFLYVAFNAPHYPYQGTPRWRDEYQQRNVPEPRQSYAAFLSTCDERIAGILATLDQLHLADQTIVIAQSDHGHSREVRAHSGGGWAGPFRGCKFSLFEGGIRVPSFIRWPEGLPRGESREAMVHGCDWFPTLCSLAGLPWPDRPLDGRDITSVLRSGEAPSPHPRLRWKAGGAEPSWAITDGRWKLLHRPIDPAGDQARTVTPGLFLADLQSDVSESNNLAEQHRDIAERLRRLYEQDEEAAGRR